MKRSLLKVLMVMALGAVICLPGVAAAGITLDFNLAPGVTDLNGAGGNYDLFTWVGWTVADGTVSAGDGATISLKDNTSFTFDGADFALNGATSLTITGTKVGGGTVVFPTAALGSSLQTYSFENSPGITLLTFTTKTDGTPGGNFVMDNFADVAGVPLPASVLLLGSGLLGLVGMGWRRARKED